MDYEILKGICRMNKISLQSVANDAGLTLEGLKRGFDNDSLAAKYIMRICEFLYITPNRLFGVQEPTIRNVQTQNGGVGNTQVAESGAVMFQEQLKEKDAQISRLLGIIEKLNK